MLVKEELAHYLTRGHIHVSRQDFLFFSNLEKLSNERRVTTGQDKLLNKLLDKYKRQLLKENLNSDDLKKLSWRFDLIETKPEYQQPKLSLENDTLILKTPFNKKLINEINRFRQETNFFIWDKEDKAYKCKATNYALKEILIIIENIFENTVYCDKLQALIEEANQYSKYIWKPTLVKSNDNFYVAALNETLYEHIKDLELNNSANTLFKLGKLGITANKELIDTEEKEFAINVSAEIDINQVPNMAIWLKNLGIYTVSFGYHMVAKNKLFKNLQNALEKEGIAVTNVNELKNSDNYVICQFRSFYGVLEASRSNPHKYVFIKNSNPIDVK